MAIEKLFQDPPYSEEEEAVKHGLNKLEGQLEAEQIAKQATDNEVIRQGLAPLASAEAVSSVEQPAITPAAPQEVAKV